MVFPASHGVSRAPQYSGTVSRKIAMFRLRDSHPLWLSIPGAFSYTNDFVTSRVNPETAPQPCPYCYEQFGLFPFRSPLLRESLIDFSSWGY